MSQSQVGFFDRARSPRALDNRLRLWYRYSDVAAPLPQPCWMKGDRMETAKAVDGDALASDARSVGTFEAVPEDLEAILAEFRRDARVCPVFTHAAAEKVVMRTRRYKDHLDLARRTVRFLQGRRLLCDRAAGGLIFNDPRHPLTSAEIRELQTARRVSATPAAQLPEVEACRAYLLSLGRDSCCVVRGTHEQLARRLEVGYKLAGSAPFDLLNALIDAGVIVPDSEVAGTYRVLRVGEASEEVRAAETPAAIDPQPPLTSAAPSSPVAQAPKATAARREVRITPREERLLIELMDRDEVESLYTLACQRLGSVASAKYFHEFVTTRLGLLVSVRRGTGPRPSLHRVSHAAFDRFTFTPDSTLDRVRNEGPEGGAKATSSRSTKGRKVAKAAQDLPADSPEAILARVERDLKVIEAEETEDRAGYEARTKERARRLSKLEAVRAKARELIELVRGTKF